MYVDVLDIQIQKGDVLMTSVPTTTQDEMPLFRTLGGCLSTGRVAHLDQTTTGPSTLTNPLRCWTLAPHRLRSLLRTPALL